MGEWQAVHDKHAIAVVAVVINFSGEMPARLALKLQDHATEVGKGVGLTNTAPVHGIAFDPTGGIASATETIGVVLSSVHGIPTVPGFPLDFSRQLQVQRNSITYRTSVYTRWQDMRSELEVLLSPLIAMVSEVIGIESIRFEYLDIFIYSGDINEANLSGLISQSSPMVSAHVFKGSANWHCHTGDSRALDIPGSSAIIQVNLDSNTLRQRSGNGTAVRRLVNLMTAREDRMPFGRVEKSDYNNEIVLRRLDEMHEELKRLVVGLLVKEMRLKVGLEESS
jgi:uncharacterized protein (TIGR04255 family)